MKKTIRLIRGERIIQTVGKEILAIEVSYYLLGYILIYRVIIDTPGYLMHTPYNVIING